VTVIYPQRATAGSVPSAYFYALDAQAHSPRHSAGQTDGCPRPECWGEGSDKRGPTRGEAHVKYIYQKFVAHAVADAHRTFEQSTIVGKITNEKTPMVSADVFFFFFKNKAPTGKELCYTERVG